jgi:hypothetical protein
VVDDFIDRIMVDPRLNANPRVDEAHHRVSPGFKYLVSQAVVIFREKSANLTQRHGIRLAKPGPSRSTVGRAGRSHGRLPFTVFAAVDDIVALPFSFRSALRANANAVGILTRKMTETER